MADDKSSIFTEKAQGKLRSPDDLNEYVRVTNPSVWVVLAACIVLLAGLLAWGLFGTVTTSVRATGAYVDGQTVCFLPADKASKVNAGDVANVGGALMEVESMSAVPLSRAEVREIVGGDYLADTLAEDDWVYAVRFISDGEPGFSEGVPLSVDITTEKIAPIELLFGDAA